MNDRLTALDVSFLYLEGESTPMHVGGLAVFDAPVGGFDYERFVRLIEERIALVPRYRQKIKSVPGHIAYPVWVDDAEFDVSFHVRRSALPRPGSNEQLRELVARLQSRPLDRSRPLWEMNIVEGLAGGGFAIITKTHHAMVDGISAVDIAQVILDRTTVPRDTRPDRWQPRSEPGPVDLVVDAVRDLVSRPGAVVDTVRMGVNDARASTVKLVRAVTGLVSAARVAARPAPSSPLNVTIGAQRRFAVARTSLSDYREVRTHVQGTVNDVVLATVAGALRGWLLARGQAVTPTTTVRAMVPLSVRTGAASELGNRVSSYLVDLPVGEPNPLVRLTQISYAMTAHKESGQSVGADALIALSGFAPPTLHALGARAANSFTRRLFNLVVTNVPGPQYPLFADGAQMREMFPIVPLAAGQAVSIGLTSYNGHVFYGLNADRDAMADIDTLAVLIEESLAELITAVRSTPGQRATLRPKPVAALRSSAAFSATADPVATVVAPPGSGSGSGTSAGTRAQSGSATSGPATSAAAKSGPVTLAAAKSGPAKPRVAKSGPAKSGPAQSGTVKAGRAKAGPAKAGRVSSARAKSERATSGPVKSGSVAAAAPVNAPVARRSVAAVNASAPANAGPPAAEAAAATRAIDGTSAAASSSSSKTRKAAARTATPRRKPSRDERA